MNLLDVLVVFFLLSMSFVLDAQVFAAEKPVPNPTLRAPFKARELPPEPAQDHDSNKVLDLGPLRQSVLMPMSSTRPIRLEASYTEPMGLEDALKYAVQFNLPIKIAKESWTYQKWQFYGQVADFLPSYT
ncbi:MAG: hypothetical protein K2X81_19515, partial [Candidatus Obscuribacterales bacterium]|nr:hypothetical protein [Candidatus Obscuribacterales bacterium]